jgi:arylsulfatase A-like enzyme
MVEAMDSEIGRLLDSIEDDAVVIFLGDNGTPQEATDGGWDPEHAKSTLYEGGINVPLIVNGAGVFRGECDALVNVTDLFATVLELAGVGSGAEDSTSIAPYFSDINKSSIRDWAYAERETVFGEHRKAVRDRRYKLISCNAGDELYDLEGDPFEQSNLLDGRLTHVESLAYDRLSDVLGTLVE